MSWSRPGYDSLTRCSRSTTATGGGDVKFGLQVTDSHINSFEALQGGVIMTLVDLLCARNIWQKLERAQGVPTVSLSFNSLGIYCFMVGLAKFYFIIFTPTTSESQLVLLAID